MNLTSKSRYAIKIMMDLALYQKGDSQVHRKDIAKRQGISADYLDQIMVRLRKKGIVESLRGRSGGYRLSSPADQISLLEIFTAAEGGSISPVECLDQEANCNFSGMCISEAAWQKVNFAIAESLKGITLASLISQNVDQFKMCPASGVKECKPGRAS